MYIRGVENTINIINEEPNALIGFFSRPKNQFLVHPSHKELKSSYIWISSASIPTKKDNL